MPHTVCKQRLWTCKNDCFPPSGGGLYFKGEEVMGEVKRISYFKVVCNSLPSFQHPVYTNAQPITLNTKSLIYADDLALSAPVAISNMWNVCLPHH